MNQSVFMAALAGICGATGAVSGKLAFDGGLDQITTASCFAVFILSNIAMWATYTRSLALSLSTYTPLIINMSFNFAITIDYKIESLAGEPNLDPNLLINKEWISEKSPDYPLEVKFGLSKFSEVEKIEIVAHNTFIPRKLAIFSTNFIGEVEFKKSGDAKFELKNIFLDEKCDFLIFKVYEPYPDNNEDLQVGLVDVKLFGKYMPTGENPPEGIINDKIPDRKYSKEFMAMIEAIEKNKQIAVANEDFKLAKSAQLAVRQLKKSTKEMEELENDKSEAVRDGDYQRAIDLQDEITILRSTVIASIEPRLLDNTMKTNDEIHRPKNLFIETDEKPPSKPKLYEPVDLSPTEVPSDPAHTYLQPSKRRPNTTDSRSSSNTSRRTSLRSSSSASRSTATPKRSAPSTPKTPSRRRSSASSTTTTNKFMEKENMIVPAALRRTSYQIPEDEQDFSRSSDVQELTENQVLEMIPPDGRGNIRSSISIFGLPIIAKIYSKQFENRKEAVSEIRQRIDKMSNDELHSNFESVNYLIIHMLKDPLYLVYKDVLLLWHHFCTSRLVELRLERMMNRVSAESVEIFASRVLASDKRIVNDTMKTFRDASKLSFIAKSYSAKLLTSNSKNLKGRAILIDLLAKLHDIPNEEVGLTASPTSSFATKCIQISDQQVRTIGKDLMLKLFKNGEEQTVRQELHKFAVSDPNNPTYQKILRQIGPSKKPADAKKISFML